MNEDARKNKGKSTKVQNNPAKTVHYLPENDNLKSGHAPEFELVLDLPITKYEPPSAPTSESEEQINPDNVADLLEKILGSDEKDDLIDFDKDSQDLPSLVQIATGSRLP